MRGHVVSHVRDARLKKHLTQEELAGKVKVTRQTIIAIEKGNYAPSVYLAIQLGKVLDARVEELFKV